MSWADIRPQALRCRPRRALVCCLSRTWKPWKSALKPPRTGSHCRHNL